MSTGHNKPQKEIGVVPTWYCRHNFLGKIVCSINWPNLTKAVCRARPKRIRRGSRGHEVKRGVADFVRDEWWRGADDPPCLLQSTKLSILGKYLLYADYTPEQRCSFLVLVYSTHPSMWSVLVCSIRKYVWRPCFSVGDNRELLAIPLVALVLI